VDEKSRRNEWTPRQMDRRNVLRLGVGIAAAGFTAGVWRSSAISQAPAEGQSVLVEEILTGDPNGMPEKLKFDPGFVESIIKRTRGRGPRKDPKAVAAKMVQVANRYIGVSRSSNPEQVKQFLSLFGLGLTYSTGGLVPYCAAGLSFCVCQAYCELTPSQIVNQTDPNRTYRDVIASINSYYLRPSASCAVIAEDANRRGTWLERPPSFQGVVQPGWIALFDWNASGKPEHIGIVESCEPQVLNTIEFNTSLPDVGNNVHANSNGGTVAKKERPIRYLLGLVKTY
jgi:hypothetical protein